MSGYGVTNQTKRLIFLHLIGSNQFHLVGFICFTPPPTKPPPDLHPDPLRLSGKCTKGPILVQMSPCRYLLVHRYHPIRLLKMLPAQICHNFWVIKFFKWFNLPVPYFFFVFVKTKKPVSDLKRFCILRLLFCLSQGNCCYSPRETTGKLIRGQKRYFLSRDRGLCSPVAQRWATLHLIFNVKALHF